MTAVHGGGGIGSVKKPARSVLHIDMNAFYCACHASAEPERYLGKPTAVAGSPQKRHGVVVTASYEARARGVRATMTVAEALRACPELILIHPDFDLYRQYSREVFERVRTFTPQIEIFSIDECWADVTGSRQFGTPMEIAAKLQQALQHHLGLPSSIGIGPNKLIAKMASDFRKPLGITEISEADVERMLWPLPVTDLFGVGRKSGERLHRLGIETIGQLANADADLLIRHFGRHGTDMKARANGYDNSPVNANPEPLKSVGHSITLSEDIASLSALNTVLLNLADQVGRRARRHQLIGRTVQITIRYGDRQTFTRARTLNQPTDLTEEIYEAAKELLAVNKASDRKVRLLGVTLMQLQSKREHEEAVRNTSQEESVQLSLFADESASEDAGDAAPDEDTPRVSREKLERLTEVADKLRNKYGEDILLKGRMLQVDESRQIRDRKIRGTSLQKDTLRDAPH